MIDIANSNVSAFKKHLAKHSWHIDPWLGAVLICFVLLAWASWGKLAHPIFDTGQETEIAARLLAGQQPYRDLQISYGPLAYYVNALALLIFGHHMEVFYTVGLVLALAATLLVYQLTKQLTNTPWATLCTVYVLIYCAFTPGGLWNFIVPYSYGAMYATVFCLLALTAVDRYGCTRKIEWLVAAALTCGLAGLAKQEYGVAALVSVLVGVNLCSVKDLRARVGRSLLVVVVAVACVVVPLALLAQQVSWAKLQMSMLPFSKSRIFTESGLFDVSLAKTLDIWKSSFVNFAATTLVVIGAMVAGRWFSKREWLPPDRWIRVFIEIIGSVAIAWFGILVGFKIFAANFLLVGVAILLFRWIFSSLESKWLRILIGLIVAIAFASLSIYLFQRLPCCSYVRPLDNMAWLLPMLVGWFVLRWKELVQHRHAPLLWALLVFSVLLNARFLFYINFYALYAVTAILLFFTLLYHLAVRTAAPIWKYLLICLVVGGGMNLVEFGQYRYAVHSPHGTIYTKDADLALAFNQTIQYINTSAATSVLTVPAGATLNFLTATHSPSQETIFLPGILPSTEAEQEFIARMQDKPPTLIVYVDVPFWWLKKGYQTYAEFNPLIDRWIRHQHRLVYSSPNLVFGDKEWTLRIYNRD